MPRSTGRWLRRHLVKTRSVAMNRSNIGPTSWVASTVWPFSSLIACAYETRSRCTTAGSTTDSLTGVSSTMAPIFKRAMIPSTLIRFQYQVAIDEHANRETRSNCQCRLDIEVAADDLLTSLIHGVAGASSQGTGDVAL